MRSARYVPVVALLVAVTGCDEEEPGGGEKYFAEQTAPCGRELMSISATEDGPRELVQAVGPMRPSVVLKYRVSLGGKWFVHGHKTGQVVDDGHCGSYPEFVVTAFEPRGPIERTVSIEGLDTQFQYYTEDLPTDRYVPEDFEQGPPGRFLDTCTPIQSDRCELPRVTQTNADGRLYCCSLADDEWAPKRESPRSK